MGFQKDRDPNTYSAASQCLKLGQVAQLSGALVSITENRNNSNGIVVRIA